GIRDGHVTGVQTCALPIYYQLQFNRGAPSQIVVYNFPFSTSINNLFSQAAYVTDTFSVKRVTINAGVRWERYHNYYPAQTKEARSEERRVGKEGRSRGGAG